jgi:hypothetical protein
MCDFSDFFVNFLSSCTRYDICTESLFAQDTFSLKKGKLKTKVVTEKSKLNMNNEYFSYVFNLLLKESISINVWT